jgi:hypothetical protein
MADLPRTLDLAAGLTAVGTATIHVLAINTPDYVEVRQALIDEGVFPR